MVKIDLYLMLRTQHVNNILSCKQLRVFKRFLWQSYF